MEVTLHCGSIVESNGTDKQKNDTKENTYKITRPEQIHTGSHA